MPDFLSRYLMLERTDFQQQTSAVNLIDDTLITEVMRRVCYNQIIYDDLRLEMNEYAGLTFGVRNDDDVTTVRTFVKDMFDQGAILIVDNDSEFFHAKCHRILSKCLLCFPQGRWWVWSRHFSVSRRMSAMLSSAL